MPVGQAAQTKGGCLGHVGPEGKTGVTGFNKCGPCNFVSAKRQMRAPMGRAISSLCVRAVCSRICNPRTSASECSDDGPLSKTRL